MGHGHDAEGVVATAVRAEPLIELLRAVTARSGDLEELALRYPASLVAREQDRLACIRARIRERAAELLEAQAKTLKRATLPAERVHEALL